MLRLSGKENDLLKIALACQHYYIGTMSGVGSNNVREDRGPVGIQAILETGHHRGFSDVWRRILLLSICHEPSFGKHNLGLDGCFLSDNKQSASNAKCPTIHVCSSSTVCLFQGDKPQCIKSVVPSVVCSVYTFFSNECLS